MLMHSLFRSLLVIGLMSSVTVWGLDLGRLSVYSTVGQPLKVKVELKNVSDEELDGLSARISPSDAESGAASSNLGILLGANYVVEPTADRTAILTVTTEKPFAERSVSMIVELAWPSGRAVKEYSFLLDAAAAAGDVKPPVAEPFSPLVQDSSPVIANASVANVPVRVGGSAVPLVPDMGQFIPGVGLTPSIQPSVSLGVAPNVPQSAISAMAVQPALVVSDSLSAPVLENRLEAPVLMDAPLIEAPLMASNSAKTYIVKSGDTLSAIASNYIFEGLNLDQMLVALYRRNSYLFGQRNMNMMEVGIELEIPTKENLDMVSVADARLIVDAQYADFRSLNNTLRESSGKVRVSPSINNPSKKSGDRLLMTNNVDGKGRDGVARSAMEDNVAQDIVSASTAINLGDAVSLNGSLKEIAAREGVKQSSFEYAKYLIYGLPLIAFIFLLIYGFFRFRASREANFSAVGYKVLDGGNAGALYSEASSATFRRPRSTVVDQGDSRVRSRASRLNANDAKMKKSNHTPENSPSNLPSNSISLNQLFDKLSQKITAPPTGSSGLSEKAQSENQVNLVDFDSVHNNVSAMLEPSKLTKPDFHLLDDNTEMNIKYDLALAYIDIGEKDTASQLLNEVIMFGTEDISQKAKKSLALLQQEAV